jgi:hypothetical protein
LINASVEYRFLQEKTQFDMTTIVFQQTCFGLPIWEAGLAVHMKHDPFRIVSAQSTSHSDLEVKKPTANALSQLEKLDDAQLLPLLGLSSRQKEWDLKSFKIQSQRLIIYRYKSVKRLPELGKPSESEERAFVTEHHSLPLPPVGKGIEERQHCVAVEVHFILGSSRNPDLRWVAIIEATTLSVLYLRAFVDNVNGMVFRNDPMTDNGGPLPGANNVSLNAARTSELLQGLNAPVAGTQSLSGSNVTLTDPEAPTVASPTEPANADFNFDARTNDFAAVNAYYHCDRFFRLLQDLGFSLSSYLGGTPLPSTVDHRGQ